MQIPDVFKHHSSRSFFAEFVDSNKQANSKFSIGFLSKKLEWPRSYLSDLIAGRRGLTISRALQFAKKNMLSDVDTERIVLLAVIDSNVKSESNYGKTKLGVASQDFYHNEKEKASLFSQRETAAVFSLLQLSKRMLSIRQICDALFTFDLDEERAQEIVKFLEEKKLVVIDREKGEVSFARERLVWDVFPESDDPNVLLPIHAMYSENTNRFCARPKRPMDLNSGFVRIPLHKMESAKIRIAQLRKYLFSLKDGAEDSALRLYQFDLNLFPISDLDAIDDAP